MIWLTGSALYRTPSSVIFLIVHDLDFYFNGLELTESENMKFVQSVDRVFLHHDHGLLNKFSLKWLFHCTSFQSHVISWVSNVIKRNVHQLYLCLVTSDGLDKIPIFTMPISVFISESLQSLELDGIFFDCTAITGCLSRLESLKLNSVDFEFDETFEELINGCPMLKYLDIHREYGCSEDFMCIISSVSLKWLRIWFGENCILKLNASSLEYLEVKGHISEIFVQKNLSSLVDAELSLYLENFSNNSVVEAVCAIDGAKVLALSSDVLQTLSCTRTSLSIEFKRLVNLYMETSLCDCSSLLDFIQKTDNIEVLTLNKLINSIPKNWTSPLQVPRCLSNTLKKVIVDNYKGYEDEREMIRYILKNGCVLEIVKIYYHETMNESEKLKLGQEICKFPRMSAVVVNFFSRA